MLDRIHFFKTVMNQAKVTMNKRSTQLSIYKTLLTLYLIVFLNTLGYFLIFPVLSKIVTGQERNIVPQGWSDHLGDYLFPVVLGAGSIASIVVAPLIGRLSDILGRKTILVVCTILLIVSFVLPVAALLTGSILLLLIGNALNGVASANRPIAQAAISDLSRSSVNKVIRYAIDIFVICVAMIIGPMAGSWLSDAHLVSWFNDQTPFIAAGILTIIALGLLMRFLPETYQYASKWSNVTYKNSVASFSDVIRLRPRAWQILLIIFLIQGAWAQFFQYVYIYLPNYLHFSQQATSNYVSLLGVYLSFGLLAILPLLIRRLYCSQIIMGCAIIAMLSFLGLSIWPSAAWWWALPLAITMAMYYPCILAMLTEMGSELEQGWLMTWNSVMLGLSWFITAFSGIWLSHYSAQLPIIICTVIMAVASILATHLWWLNNNNQ